MEYEEKWFVAVTISLIFFLSNSSVDFAESDHHTLPCYTVKNDYFILYVVAEIEDDSEGYRLFVSEETYKNHDVGDTYERITCELAYLNEIKTIIDELLDAGILEVNE
jgi:hypothetical protein